MIRFLFWNVCNNAIEHRIAALCDEQNVDVVVLAELNDTRRTLLPILNANADRLFYEAVEYAASLSGLKVFARFLPRSILPIEDASGFTIYRLTPIIGPTLTLVAIHLSSKLFMDSRDQSELVTRVIRAIERKEESEGHDRTLVIGDFNMNPFEDGLVSSEKLHAVMDRGVARKEFRIVSGVRRKFFYNPSWNLLGDLDGRPPGTYYYPRSTPISLFWNTFDQAMIRPSILPYFPQNGLRLISSIGDTSLIRNGKVDKRISDHLPILIELNLDEQ